MTMPKDTKMIVVRVYHKSDGRFLKDVHCFSMAQARRFVARCENVHSLTRFAIILDEGSNSNE